MANKLTRFDPYTDLTRFERPFGGLQELFEQFGMQPFGRGGSPCHRSGWMCRKRRKPIW